MKVRIVFLFTLLLYIGSSIMCSSCGDKKPTSTTNTPKVDTFKNIIIVLDLSSRVKLPNQDKKDLAILKQVSDVFEKTQRGYGFQISKDKLDVKIAFQDGAITQPFNFGDDLTIDMAAHKMNKPNFDIKKGKFLNAIDKLYVEAVNGNTTGADLWNFFDDQLEVITKKKDNNTIFINKIIILTDGYLEFSPSITNNRPNGTYFNPAYKELRNKPDWEKQIDNANIALKPCGHFDNTEVLMLELAPANPAVNTNELQILKSIWTKWFSQMNIKSEIMKTDDNTENLRKIIEDFIIK